MTPAEAAASLDEPNWVAWFKDLGGDFPPPMRRSYSSGGDGIGRRSRSTASTSAGRRPRLDGIIALAQLGVRYPTLLQGRPPGLFEAAA